MASVEFDVWRSEVPRDMRAPFNPLRQQLVVDTCARISDVVQLKLHRLEGLIPTGVSDCFCIAQLTSKGIPIAPAVVTPFASRTSQLRCVWGVTISFAPLCFLDLPFDTMLCLTVCAASTSSGTYCVGAVVGGASVAFFSREGVLKQGTRRYPLRRGFAASSSPYASNVTASDDTTDPLAASLLSRARPSAASLAPAVPWLDALASDALLQQRRAEDIATLAGASVLTASALAEEIGGVDEVRVTRQKARCRCSRSRKGRRSNVEGEGAPTAVDPVGDGIGEGEGVRTQRCCGGGNGCGRARRGGEGILQRSDESRTRALAIVVAFPVFNMPVLYSVAADAPEGPRPPFGSAYCMPDADAMALNPAEAVYSKIVQADRMNADPSAVPSASARAALIAIEAQPPLLAQPPTSLQTDVLWAHRWWLARRGKSLVAFLRAVDWLDAVERREATRMLSVWEAAGVSVADALAMLGSSYSGISEVRSMATTVLSAQSDAALISMALQLVQALRYEVEMATSPLANLLLTRACKNYRLASTLYWLLVVEADDPYNAAPRWTPPCKAKFGQLRDTLVASLPPRFRRRVDAEVAFNDAMTALQSEVKAGRGDRPAKIKALNAILGSGKLSTFFSNSSKRRGGGDAPEGGEGGDVNAADAAPAADSRASQRIHPDVSTLPSSKVPADGFLPPCVAATPLPEAALVVGVRTDDAYLFKSAMMPMKLTLYVISEESAERICSRIELAEGRSSTGGGGGRGGDAFTPLEASDIRPYDESVDGGTFCGESVTSVGVILKFGDDLRQDQLVLQLIRMMHAILLENGLDLHLVPYGCVATSTQTGWIECVPDCRSFSRVKTEGVAPYLRRANPSDAAYEAALERYVRSCAGYCVVTYLLAVGDRHLDNIQLRSDGVLLHIDFGWVFGRDPKPFPPAVKLTPVMVEGMVREGSLLRFQSFCCTAYNILRRHADKLLRLIALMLHANLPHLAGDSGSDPVSVFKVQERFRLHERDADAAASMQALLDNAVRAIVPRFWDQMHAYAQWLRA